MGMSQKHASVFFSNPALWSQEERIPSHEERIPLKEERTQPVEDSQSSPYSWLIPPGTQDGEKTPSKRTEFWDSFPVPLPSTKEDSRPGEASVRWQAQFKEMHRAYASALAFRSSTSQKVQIPGGLVAPDASVYSRIVRSALENNTQAQIYLGSLRGPSVRRIGQSSMHFLQYLYSSHTFDDFLDYLQTRNLEELCGAITGFYSHYSGLPVSRVSPVKLFHSRDSLSRSLCKEASTMKTEIRGVIGFLTIISALPLSSSRNPSKESLVIWNNIEKIGKCWSTQNRGPVNMPKFPLTVVDLIECMRGGSGCSNIGEVQSWALMLLLASTGLRPGSITAVPAAKAAATDAESESSSSDDEEGGESDGHTQGGDNEEVPRPSECLIDFEHMTLSDVRLFRVKPEPGDSPDSVRLHAELSVVHDKVLGTRVYSPTVIGISYPTSMHVGTAQWNWEPNGAIGLTMVLMIHRVLDLESLFRAHSPSDALSLEGRQLVFEAHKGDTRPLFGKLGATGHLRYPAVIQKGIQSLQLPTGLYSAKSLRCGFASQVIRDFVMRKTDDELVTFEDIRRVLYTTSHWKSAQCDAYIRMLKHGRQRYGVTDAGSTVTDWLQTLYMSSPIPRLHNFKHVNMEGLRTAL